MIATAEDQVKDMTARLVEEALELVRQRAVDDATTSRLMCLCRDASEAAIWTRVRLALKRQEWTP